MTHRSCFRLIYYMSLSYALLTSLLEQPSTGIELARRFDRSVGFFWQATHQQIYRELNSMLKNGWVSTLEQQGYAGRKKTYTVEYAGRQALTEWMVAQSPPAQLRDELMVKVRASAQLGSHSILPELERHLQLHLETLKVYQQIYAKDFAQDDATLQLHADQHQDHTRFIHKMILQLGIKLEQGWVDWLQLFIPQLQAFAEQADQQPSQSAHIKHMPEKH